MKYSVDKIENDIAVLENIDDGTKIEVSTTVLPDSLKEGNILYYENESYKIDIREETKRRKRIRSKFDMLKKNKVDNN